MVIEMSVHESFQPVTTNGHVMNFVDVIVSFLLLAIDLTMNDVYVYFPFLNVNVIENDDDVVLTIDVLHVMMNLIGIDLVNVYVHVDYYVDHHHDLVWNPATDTLVIVAVNSHDQMMHPFYFQLDGHVQHALDAHR